MNSSVLITGATGFVGGHLVKACISKGWKVRVFTLPGDEGATALLEMGVELFEGDISDAEAVLNSAKGTDLIFHCAGIVSDWAPDELFRKVIVDGTENVCAAAKAADVKRLVHISTNDVFGMIEYKVIDESMPLRPWNEPYPDYKILAEEVVWKYQKEGLPATVIYPCWVYGEGDKTFVPLLADAIIGKDMLFWRKDVLVWPTYIDNLVSLLMVIATDDRAIGQGFLVHDGDSTTLQQFSSEIAKAMEVKPPGIQLPYFIAMNIARAMETAWRLLKLNDRPLLTTYAVKNLGSRFRYSISKAAEQLGWSPAISYEEGMKRTMNWLKTLDRDKLKQK